MGSNKSKPIKESARTVLARRKKEIIDDTTIISTPTTTSSSITTSTTSSIPPTFEGQKTIDRINNYNNNYNNNNNNIDNKTLPKNISKIIGPNDGLDLDPKILKTIDKWILKEKQIKYPGSDTNKDKMATILRLEEEKLILKETGKMPLLIKGRLTEEQINKFYEIIKENNIEKCNDNILSNEFNIPINMVILLKKIARLPNIYMDGWSEIKDQKVGK